MKRLLTFGNAILVASPSLRAGEIGPSDRGIKQSGLGDKLARSSIAAFMIHSAGMVVTYSMQVVLARTIGAAEYGVYAYAFAWLTALSYIAALGFDISLLRFIPAYLATRSFSLLRGLIEYSGRRACGLGCAISLVGVAIILACSRDVPPRLANAFLVGFILVPIFALLRLRTTIVRGFGGVLSALGPDRLVRDAVLLVAVAGMATVSSIDAPRAMGAAVLAAAAALGLVSLTMRSLRPNGMSTVVPTYEQQVWRRTIAPLVIVAIGDALTNRVGILILGWVVGTQQAGVYAVAFNVSLAVTLPQVAVNTLLAPVISDLFVRNDRAGLQAMVAKSSLWTLFGATCIALPVLAFAETALALFGTDFVAGSPALRILVVAQVIAAAAGSQLHLLNMTGHERRAAILLVSSIVANATLAIALVRPLGPIGAAFAAAVALLAWNTVMGISILRHLQLLPGILSIFGNRKR
jgi:O-antigen/teichoic acid export membrane protein